MVIEITVVMPVYNGMPYLPEAVESILEQTLKDFKLLIINDGSNNGTEEYLNRLDEPRVQVVHQPNRGQGVARNVGLDICDSEFVAIMDADDVALPTRLEAQLSFLRRHREVGMVGTKFAYLGDGGRSGFSPPMPCNHENIYSELLCGRLSLCNSTLMCRTSILKKIGGYRISSKGEDWDMFLRMGEVTRLANLNDILHLYRLHPGSENARILAQVRLRQAYARDCAKSRAEGKLEITFDDFIVKQRALTFWQRTAETIDTYALSHYRLALAEILSHRQIKRVNGYLRLAWAAMCSPRWTSQRISRTIRKLRKS